MLTAIPFVVYLFATASNYQRSLAFILPGLWTTIIATVLSYIAASILGLILAGLLLLKLGAQTTLRHTIAAILMLAGSVYFFTRPPEDYSLIGGTEGRVAIIKGTPARLSDKIKAGSYQLETDESVVLAVRAVENTDAALERLASGAVTAAFIPSDRVPPGQTVLWRVTFLPDGARRSALLLLVLGFFGLLLVFGAWSSGHHPFAIFAELYVDAMRGIPMLVIILYVGFPLQGAIREATGGLIDMSRLTRGVVGVSLGYAAYMAEIFRAGIQAIPRGQIEAAKSLGLTGWQTARYVVMPQALKIVIPPLGNEFIAMLKDTSLLSVLSVRDITQRTREFSSHNFMVFPPFNTVAVLYIALTLAASSLIKWIERHASKGGD